MLGITDPTTYVIGTIAIVLLPGPNSMFVLSVAAHERFERDGFNILSEVEIGYAQAVLGAEVEVETLHGTEELVVPPGTCHGEQFRLKGKGVDRLGGSGRGDHFAVRLRDLAVEPISKGVR